MPVLWVQRNASVGNNEPPTGGLLSPTTTEPSALTPLAMLYVPPGKKPRPTMPVL